MNNVCQVCKKARATVHLTEIDAENAEPTEMHLCENCARDSGTSQKASPSPSASVSFTTSLIDLHKKKAGASAGQNLVCPECGMTYQEFRVKGRFGCVTCYDAFAAGLVTLLEKVHGASEHVGPPPPPSTAAAEPAEDEVEAPVDDDPPAALRRELGELRRQLRSVVDEENYEEAARLRDRISEVESRIGEPDE